MSKVTKQAFLHDIRDHIMTVKNDSYPYRHLICKKPDSIIYSFEIITSDDILTFTGDMQTYVFKRPRTDMLSFFLLKNIYNNLGYINEKCVAQPVGRGAENEIFDEDIFCQDICNRFAATYEIPHFEYREAEPNFNEMYVKDDIKEAKVIWEKMKDDLFISPDYENLVDFECGGFVFDECGDFGYKYNDYFIWCMYAINWAAKEYEKLQIKS